MGLDRFAYLGTAQQYPLTLVSGKPEIVSGKAVIEGSLRMLLTTPVGSRYFLPEFGCRIEELIFEPTDAILQKLLEVYITEAITKWEKRIRISSISVLTNTDRAVITVKYVILPSNEIDSFIYPFFRGKNPIF